MYQGVRVKHTVKDLLAEKRSRQTSSSRLNVSPVLRHPEVLQAKDSGKINLPVSFIHKLGLTLPKEKPPLSGTCCRIVLNHEFLLVMNNLSLKSASNDTLCQCLCFSIPLMTLLTFTLVLCLFNRACVSLFVCY